MNKVLNFELPSGVKVEMDLNRFKVRTVMDARACASGGYKTTLFILADICKFDGEKITAPDLEEYDGFDLLCLEDMWDKAREDAAKKPQASPMSSSSRTTRDGAKKKS